MRPRVTVICICYNHASYIGKALDSVLKQTYENIELIVVDNGSIDDSTTEISSFLKKHPGGRTIQNPKGTGYCKAFNTALEYSSGEYIIDLAGDDFMMPFRVENQLGLFEKSSNKVGVVYSDAEYVDGHGNHLNYHFKGPKPKVSRKIIPEGDIYNELLAEYIVAAPTMMIRKRVFQDIGGYDENLSFEDFNFWVRSSRKWHYAYLSEVTTKITVNSTSMSSQIGKKEDRQLLDTFLVCKKAQQLNTDLQNQKALRQRLRYQLRFALRKKRFKEASLFADLLLEEGERQIFYQSISKLCKHLF